MDLHEGKSPEEIEAAICRRSFAAFIKKAWPLIDPEPLIWGWHMQSLADHLQAVTELKILKLIINIPPGMAKSMIVSVLWPAWNWARKPSWQMLGASYEQGLATRDAVKARELMRSDWYTKWFRSADSPLCARVGGWDFSADTDQKTYYKNTGGGHRVALGVGGKGTGYRGHCLVIDDPISAEDAHSKIARDTCIRWKTQTMSSRFNKKSSAQQVLIMQRLHEDDLSGYLLKEGGWEHLRLPARFDSNKPSSTKTILGRPFWNDPRKSEGELLSPQLLSDDVLKGLKVELGSYGFAGQYQQTPSPAEGGILKREWFNRRWLLPNQTPVLGLTCRPLPLNMDMVGIFTDAAFKAKEDSDYVAIAVVGLKWPDCYLMQLAWDRMTFGETVAKLIDLRRKWKMCQGVYVEDKANGSAIMDVLKDKIPGLIAVEPDGGKESRIRAIEPYVEAGNFWLPLEADWVSDYIDEAVSFPKAAHDDAIDATAYSLRKFLGENSMGILEAMAKE